MRAFWIFAFFGVFAAAAQAHVGSSDIFLDAQAGPYKLFITVRPPAVIPGVAEIEVRSQSTAVKEIQAAPMPLNTAGSRYAPVPDKLKIAPKDPQEFTGSLWLMAPGSWQVRVTVDGRDGRAEVAVPVPAYAVTTKSMGPGMVALLGVLTLLLAAGLVLIVGASARESQLAPGVEADVRQIRRSRRAMITGTISVAGILGLGFTWWGSAEKDYRQQIYKPLVMSASLGGQGVLTLTLSDPGWLNARGRNPRISPALFVRTIDDFVPDHNHLMHLYAIRQPGLDTVYHLHPEMVAAGVFRLALPNMQPGPYQLYADIVHANGFPETPVARVDIVGNFHGRALEGDDASGSALSWQNAPLNKTSFVLPDGYTMEWIRPSSPLRAREGTPFRFRLLDPTGKPARNMQFYMGMLGHAAFVKTDGTAFAHIHPTGSVSMASLMLAESQLAKNSKASDPMAGMDMNGMEMAGMDHSKVDHQMTESPSALPNEVTFPYGLPSPGRYRIFVQMKHDGAVETGVFDVEAQ